VNKNTDIRDGKIEGKVVVLYRFRLDSKNQKGGREAPFFGGTYFIVIEIAGKSYDVV
jgi:hypothetical protein